MNLYILTAIVASILITIINQASAFGTTIEEHDKHCRFTVANRGPKRNRRCKFPFKIGDRTYETCTDYKDPDGDFWCSTRVNPRTRKHIGGKGYWGYCKRGCDKKPVPVEDFVPRRDAIISNDTIPQGVPCKGRKYPPSYWEQSRGEIQELEQKIEGEWYNPQTMDGTYLPNEFDETCGNDAKIGFIVCAKGQDCDAKRGAYPFMAALGYQRQSKGKEVVRYACGATLINRRYVVTAAHCHDASKTAKQISEVVIGDYDLSNDPDCENGVNCFKPIQRFYIRPSDVIIHENWNPSKVVVNGYDIALIRLPRPAYTINEICDTSVVPICLPWGRLPNGRIAKTPKGPEGDEYTVMGWGRTDNDRRNQGDKEEGGAYKNILQKLGVPHIETSWCKSNPQWKAFSTITTDRQICAGGRFHEDSCSGDSGGPLMVQEGGASAMYLKGIVSFGTRRCGKGFPGVYTDVSYYIDWIKSKLEP